MTGFFKKIPKVELSVISKTAFYRSKYTRFFYISPLFHSAEGKVKA